MPVFDGDLRFIEPGYERMIIEQYVEMVEAHLPAIREQERERIWQWGAADESERQIAMHLEDRLDEGVTTRFLFAAAVIACWALYESTVQELGDYIRAQRGIALKMSDLRGEFLKKAKTYFRDVLHIPLHVEGTDWQRLSRLALLRHFLAHANGDLRNLPASKRTRFLASIRDTPGLSIVDDRYLVVDSSFCREALLFLKELLDELIERVRSETRRAA